jgi:hypothetical protein
MLEKCFQGQRCTFSWGHVKKGNATDAFADAVLDVISKGVLYYINLLAGGSSPRGNRNSAESSLES